MVKSGTDPASRSAEKSQWTLIRGARQLLTLHGPSGPRRGSAMSDLGAIRDGAVLIRDGVIEEVGTTRRVENLEPARLAREIDAAGKVVMPAFVDPDAALAAPGDSGEPDIRRMSRRRLEDRATLMAADLVRYGVLTIGAHTLPAPDLQNTCKALRMHQAMQGKPLRIRSVFSPPYGAGELPGAGNPDFDGNWIKAVFHKKLASVFEIPAATLQTGFPRALASAAARIGYNIRVRVSGPGTPDVLELACSAGAVSVIGGTAPVSDLTRTLADVGCVTVALANRIIAGDYISHREAIDDGVPIALASGYGHEGTASLNPQFGLYMACQNLGMNAEEAIVAATYNAACSLRLSHVTGSLVPGKSADMCLMDVDNYHELTRRAGHHDVAMVIRAGKIVYRRPNLTLD